MAIYAYDLGRDCSTKTLLNGNYLYYSAYADTKIAYNGVSSYETLKTAEYSACCYMKLKFKNNIGDKKFIHRGCIEITSAQYNQIKAYRDELENTLSQYNNISKMILILIEIQKSLN